jgi:hypothetical protein
MTSVLTNVPQQCRTRAAEARQKAETASDDATRKILLRDAELWERMADFEEKNNRQFP